MSITSKVQAKHLILTSEITRLNHRDIEICSEKIQESSYEGVILDFTKVVDIEDRGLRTLYRVVSEVSQSNSKAYVVANSGLKSLIKSQGLGKLIECYSSVDEILKTKVNPPGSGKKKTLEFLTIVLEAVAYTMDVGASTKAEAKDPFFRGKKEFEKAAIGAVVGIVADAFNGTLILLFPEETYLKIMSRFLRQEYTTLSPDIVDGAAELLNTIVGQAKIKLNQRGYGIRQAIPSVIRGEGLSISPSSSPSLIVPFVSDVGNFFLEVSTNLGMAKPEGE